MPIISSSILTGLSPVTSYTASVISSGSTISNGLGNQITFLQVTASYVTASGIFGGLNVTLNLSGNLTMSFVNGLLMSTSSGVPPP